MNKVSHEIVEIVRDEFLLTSTGIDVYGNEIVKDLRHNSAGKSAAESGKRFEDLTECVLNYMSIKENCGIDWIKKPKYTCHFGLPREGDFLLYANGRQVHIECKQLGNAESHFDKLSHCLLNVINGNIEQ